MVHSPPFWVKAWFIISTILVFWDAGYCLLRPHTFAGGKYHTLWTPYVLYASVDYVYGHAVFKAGEGFTSAQAILNVVENFMNITYLLLLRAGSANAILVGFFAVTCTFWVLYWLMDQQCGWCQTGHNSLYKWIMLYGIPNSFWLVVPFSIIILFGSEISSNLRTLQKAKAKTN
ncbi:BZ3500_MvSof-1268-A1-R1_Chr5-3g08173 [Microbotryum saponariae]|uniref:BZ3500_MvSof-1268-A1-R1_Chr5-3g08173 protein n=1 Tax=Microbotryum saponariae TaxID=289078 RepID=A0A2X0NIW8_9BASI|nr:BZ3500_MvSof-1268-A1-R1_Chr5-3g08173 [Microbotryum saponariae]SDA07932.1 BZ3501_MvSof-1269-A2-R1_Chr5-1g07317 [Microbotryum saponariae]